MGPTGPNQGIDSYPYIDVKQSLYIVIAPCGYRSKLGTGKHILVRKNATYFADKHSLHCGVLGQLTGWLLYGTFFPLQLA
jgi:hypothetical protein